MAVVADTLATPATVVSPFQMPTKTFYSKLFLAAIVFTIIAMFAKNHLPKRTLTIVPNSDPNANYFLLDPEHPNARWIDRDRFHFHCKFSESESNMPCNLIYMLSVDSVKGTDLTNYDRLHLDVTYAGRAKNMRIAIRHHDPRFSRPSDSNSTKFNVINLRTSDLAKPLEIKLDEFTVADWWLAQYDLPRDQTHPDLSNAITFALDFEGDLRNTEHDVQINKIEFTGEWISNENWYLGILLCWMLFGTIYNVSRIIHLQRIEQQNRSKISELVLHNSKLRNETDKFRKLSTVDALTNTFNRHGIEQIIESLEIRLNATSIILLDIDHFKRINDRRGHDAGDRVLQRISELIARTTRSTDKLGRWGGEEFILICPNTSVGMATALAEKLRIVIFDSVFEPENPIAVTASFGVAAVSPNEPFSDAFKRADEALYSAKSLGRNCVVVAEQDSPHIA
ncbi:GGDEF domain-containing protein [Cellvibrio sp.]|uniref:GGDEF domain-containing protein n=1 Tax=Cellvibrio sp. TaxID=1965322 RepID=UPI0039647AFB